MVSKKKSTTVSAEKVVKIPVRVIAAKTKTAKAPATRTTASKAPAVKPKPVEKKSAEPKKRVETVAVFGEEPRHHYVEVAAFFIAERRNFVPGDSTADWLAAEAQVDGLIAEGKLGG